MIYKPNMQQNKFTYKNMSEKIFFDGVILMLRYVSGGKRDDKLGTQPRKQLLIILSNDLK